MKVIFSRQCRIAALVSFVILFWISAAAAWQPSIAGIDENFADEIRWGAETNCLKAGLLVQFAPATNRTLVGFYPVLNNRCQSNCVSGLSDTLPIWLPSFDRCYAMMLTDGDGSVVSKTENGIALGKQIDQPFRVRDGINLAAGYHGRILLLNKPDLILTDSFVLEDYFEITKAGKYHLQVQMTIIWPLKTNLTNIVHLPPVNTEFEIKSP